MSNAIASPGNNNGPCLNPCSHIDCIAARQIATELCRVCRERIGFEKPFYIDPDSKAGGNILFLLEEILAWTVPQTRKQGSEKRQSGQSNRGKSTRLSPVS